MRLAAAAGAGVDPEPVTPSGPPQSLCVEDSFKGCDAPPAAAACTACCSAAAVPALCLLLQLVLCLPLCLLLHLTRPPLPHGTCRCDSLQHLQMVLRVLAPDLQWRGLLE